MLVGQVPWTGPVDTTDNGIVNSSVAGSDSEDAFALVFETVLGLSEEQCSESGISGKWLDADLEDELSTNKESIFDSNGKAGISMGLFLSRGQGTQVEPGPLQGKELAPQATDHASRYEAGQQVGADGPIVPSQNSAGVLNKSQLSQWMDAHALSRSSHHCAEYCRLGMEAAGLNTADRPRSGDAGDYGPFLLRHGAQVVPQNSYVPLVGDVAVFDKTSQHPNGHIETYDGHRWVSDFMQHSFSPYTDSSTTPPFTIYRLS